MQEILIISTGGTFNKVYDPIIGDFVVDPDAIALKDIADKWLCKFEIETIIGKDSIDMNEVDREMLLKTISQARQKKIIVVHGTDTMDQSAQHIAKSNPDKIVIFTGAMVPYSIDLVESTANLASATGYANALTTNGVYIAMNGVIGRYDEVVKDRDNGKFVAVNR